MADASIRLSWVFTALLPALMANEAAWQRGHAAAVLPAAITFGVAIVASLVGLAVPGTYWVAIAAFVAGVMWVFVRANSAARAVHAS